MEQRLGVRLLNRTTRRLSLTNEGELFLENARRILADIEELERAVSSSRATPSGLLKVNATLGFGRSYIAPAISAFAKHYPEVAVQLHLTDRPLNLVDEALDVVIRFGEPSDARVVARKIADNRRLICAAPGYLKHFGRPQIPADLSRHNCLVLRQNDEAYGIWRFSLGRKINVVKVHGGLSSNDGEVVLNWALDGHGILMRSEWDITKYLRSGRLELLLEDYALPPADIFAIYPERHNLLAKMRVFLDFLVAYFGEEASSNVGRKTPW